MRRRKPHKKYANFGKNKAMIKLPKVIKLKPNRTALSKMVSGVIGQLLKSK